MCAENNVLFVFNWPFADYTPFEFDYSFENVILDSRCSDGDVY
jgi:hypothetical protein